MLIDGVDELFFNLDSPNHRDWVLLITERKSFHLNVFAAAGIEHRSLRRQRALLPWPLGQGGNHV